MARKAKIDLDKVLVLANRLHRCFGYPEVTETYAAHLAELSSCAVDTIRSFFVYGRIAPGALQFLAARNVPGAWEALTAQERADLGLRLSGAII